MEEEEGEPTIRNRPMDTPRITKPKGRGKKKSKPLKNTKMKGGRFRG